MNMYSDSSWTKKKLKKISKKSSLKRTLLKILLIIFLVFFLASSTVAVKSYLSLSNVIQKNSGVSTNGLKGDIELSKLKGEGDGRVNFLLLGTGDSNHEGPDLTDTIILASLDPKTNSVVMISIPRDLYVKIPNFGWNRINSTYALAEQQKQNTGPELTKQVVSQVLGVPIHYFLKVDFSGLKRAVDSLGGIDIYNQEDLSDPAYPCEKNESQICGFILKKGFHHMNGSLALKYVRCRKGNCGDDFGRARRQQQILMAMRDKALQLENILNPNKASELVAILGDHIKTDIQIGEIKRLVDIGRKIRYKEVTNRVLDGQYEGLVKNSNIGGASVLVPTAGVGNYKLIQSFVKGLLIDGYIKLEKAKVEIVFAPSNLARAYSLSGLLKSLGYNVIKTSTAEVEATNTEIINYSNNSKPYTLKYLENRLSVPAQSQPRPAGTDIDIKIIVGASYKP